MNAQTQTDPAPYDPATFNYALYHDLEPDVPDSQRYDGWTPDKQKRFLIALSRGLNVVRACSIVGMSKQSAYALRNSARGAAFALAWNAALLNARDVLADELMDRAFNGIQESITYDNGAITTRRRHDNQLAFKMLTRLDKQADAACTDPNAVATRLAAADFEQLLDLVARDAAPARAGLFLAARIGAAGVAKPDDLDVLRTLGRADRWLRTHTDVSEAIDTTGLDPASRADWTREQWAQAEAAGLVVLAAVTPEPDAAPESGDDARDTSQVGQLRSARDAEPVWWCGESGAWRTHFPPPPDFDGIEEGEPGGYDYARELTDEETLALEILEAAERAPVIAAGHADRERWLAECRAEAEELEAAAGAGDEANLPPPEGGGARSATEGEDGDPVAVRAPDSIKSSLARGGGQRSWWRGREARASGAASPLRWR